MTSLDHVTNYAGTEDFCVDVTKVCSLFAKRSTKPVYEDDITHTVVRYGIRNVVQSRAGSWLHAGPCLHRTTAPGIHLLSEVSVTSLYEGESQILARRL